jgi:WS/DGAT/MGAT family acyltransferase
MMKRMSGVDALFLGMETPRSYMHTFKIAILDPASRPEGWSYEWYRELVERRLHRIPQFRWRYLPAPLGLSHPQWVEDPDFFLGYHLRHISCPPPGDHRALCEFMSSVYAYQLDRSRPLWICWVVEGLEGGKVAVVTLIHHAYVDGVGAAHALQQFFNLQANDHEDPEPAPWNPPPVPSWSRRLLAGVVDLPGIFARSLPPAVSGIYRKWQLERSYRLEGKAPHPSPRLAPVTPFSRLLSHGRTFVCESMPFERLSKARVIPGSTINDVFLCCVAGALRRLLHDMGYDPNQGPLVAAIPISGERPEGMEGEGNFVKTDFSWLHIEIEDPLKRLAASHASAAEMKAHAEAARGSDITALMQLSPMILTRLIGWLIRRQGGKRSLGGNLAVSNVPGPREPLYVGEMKVENWFSTGQILDGSALNITMWSYCGKANLCILTDSTLLPDGWVLYDYFCEELAMLSAVADQQVTEATAP